MVAKSKPLALPRQSPWIELDDHRMARTMYDGLGFEVDQLPFGEKHPARLIGTLAAGSFTPGAGGPTGSWTPEFDAAKPLSDVSLQITAASTGQVVRTLTGTAPDGSIRDLRWDGRDAQGARLPAGPYHWALTAVAADGEGDLIGPDGARTITGTVAIAAS